MLRLLGDNSTKEMDKLINYENSLVTKLNRCFTGAQRYKLKRTIEDVKKSVEFNSYLKSVIAQTESEKISGIPSEFYIVNTSYNIWNSNVFDIASKFDEIETTGRISKLFKMYSSFYAKSHKNSRYLNWYLHTGSVSMNYQSNNGKISLKMLPIQALFLEMFDQEDSIKISALLNNSILGSYDRKEREKILDVFVDHSILRLNYENVELNMDIPYSGEEINIIDPFFKISKMSQNGKRKLRLIWRIMKLILLKQK